MMRPLLALACAGVATLAMTGSVRGDPFDPGPGYEAQYLTTSINVLGTDFLVSVEWSADFTTWCYTLTQDKDPGEPALSHWLLTLCEPAYQDIVSTTPFTPTGSANYNDGSTGYSGIKWEVNGDNFTTGTFCFTLGSGHLPTITSFAVMKAGSSDGIGQIYGPTCASITEVPLPAAVWMGGALIGGVIARRSLRRKSV